MGALLITYDLNRPGQDYTKLFEVIKTLGAWWHHLDSRWIVASSLTPSQAFDKLKHATDTTDCVLVVNITGDTYSGWLTQRAWDWLKNHV